MNIWLFKADRTIVNNHSSACFGNAPTGIYATKCHPICTTILENVVTPNCTNVCTLFYELPSSCVIVAIEVYEHKPAHEPDGVGVPLFSGDVFRRLTGQVVGEVSVSAAQLTVTVDEALKDAHFAIVLLKR